MIDFKKLFDRRSKTIFCSAIAIGFISMSSFSAIPKEKVVDDPEVECINRIDVEGWQPDLRIVKDDGTVNKVLLWGKAEWCAKVIYGTARRNTEAEQETVVWCILNRMESKWYPDTLEEVCSQPFQFMGFGVDNPVDEDMAKLAYKVLYSYYVDGYKPVSNDYVYMYSDEGRVVLRDTFEETALTRHWKL